MNLNRRSNSIASVEGDVPMLRTLEGLAQGGDEILEDSICRECSSSSQANSNSTSGHPKGTIATTVSSEDGGDSHGYGNSNTNALTNHPASKVLAVAAPKDVRVPVPGVDVTLSRMLAYGAFGQVYLGVRGDTGRPIAVKRIVSDGSSDRPSSLTSALRREISAMARTHHPNVVEFLGHKYDTSSCELHIMMEYLAGGSLSALLTHFGVLPELLVRVLARNILTGVAHLHSSRIVHRDIKGANVLLGYDVTLPFPVVTKIADFGCSRMIMGMTHHNMFESLQGTPHWMAPEVIKQTGHSRPADIWSVACTMVEMLTGGKPPFAEYRIPHSVMLAIANFTDPATIRLPASLTPELDRVLRLCMSPDPSARPSATALLSGECGFFLSDPKEEVRLMLDDPNCRRLAELVVDYVRDRTLGGAASSGGDTTVQVLHDVEFIAAKSTPSQVPSAQATAQPVRLPPAPMRTPNKASTGTSPNHPVVTTRRTASQAVVTPSKALVLTPSKALAQRRVRDTPQLAPLNLVQQPSGAVQQPPLRPTVTACVVTPNSTSRRTPLRQPSALQQSRVALVRPLSHMKLNA